MRRAIQIYIPLPLPLAYPLYVVLIRTAFADLGQRTQFYHVDTHQSGPHITDCGVSQISVLGPLKFVSYTEDSADLITSYQLGYHFYADGTQLIRRTRIPDVPSTVDRLQQCIAANGDWCAARRLQLNQSKTEVACQFQQVFGY